MTMTKIDHPNFKLIDPTKISIKNMPVVVFSTEDNGLLSWLIRLRTKGHYNHTMWLTPDGFASQNMTFKIKPLSRYLKPGIKLKFFRIKKFRQDYTKEDLYALINSRLSLPWWRRRYDFLGVFGQLIGLKMINNPTTFYCSEQMASDISKTVIKISGKPSPEDLEELVKVFPEFEYLGHWLGE